MANHDQPTNDDANEHPVPREEPRCGDWSADGPLSARNDEPHLRDPRPEPPPSPSRPPLTPSEVKTRRLRLLGSSLLCIFGCLHCLAGLASCGLMLWLVATTTLSWGLALVGCGFGLFLGIIGLFTGAYGYHVLQHTQTA